MSSNQTTPRIFLSYARADGEPFASALRRRLEEHGLSLWQDRTDMEGGKDWWQQILEALDHVEYLVLVMTPAAIASPIVAKEWRMARQKGVAVVPVGGTKELSFETFPSWIREVHFVDTTSHEQWARFVRTLESPVEKVRVPFMVEDLPRDFVQRNYEYEALVERLLGKEKGQSVAITAALRGAGGYGKTTLATAICHDERVQEAFHDGVLWVTLGEQPGNLIPRVEDLITVLTGRKPGFATIEAAVAILAELLQSRAMLMVIDDVWNKAHLKPFLQGGPRCARLITTRNSETLPVEALKVSVDAMRSEEAVMLLSNGLPRIEMQRMQGLASRLGEWPVLIKLVNGLLRDRVVERGELLPLALAYVGRALDKKGLTAFDASVAEERVQAIRKTIDISLQLLNEEEQQRYAELAIFPEDVEIPLVTVQKLWEATAEFDEFDTQELCLRFHNLSLLLDVNLATQRIRLHDVLRTYLLHAQTKEGISKSHGAFLDSYGLTTWLELNRKEPYLWKWLSYHLVQAGRHKDLTTLLWRFDWLRSKLAATDVFRLLEDFERASVIGTLKTVMHAIQLSADAVQVDPQQLGGQLVGRLSHLTDSDIQSLLNNVLDHQHATAWFRPLLPSLVAPGEALLRTLHGHRDHILAVAMTFDGRQVVSASIDESLKVWDLAKGQEVHTLSAHRGAVMAVVITPDGRQVVSGSGDRTLKVWDLATGQEVRTLRRHRGAVTAVAMTPDGRHVVSGSGDRTLKVWDLTTGQEVCILQGHADAVRAVAVTPDGRQIVSGSGDRTLKVWDLATGKEVQTLRGHKDAVLAVLVTPDGRQVVSASMDATLKVWDLERGQELRALYGHADAVRAVTITPDGRQLVSGAGDRTLKVWDMATGHEVRSLRGHELWITAVAVTPDGQQVVSASTDETLKIWDLAAEQRFRTRCGHEGTVTAVAVTSDGRLAVSASTDGTLKVWSMETSQEDFALSGHAASVMAVAVTPDGRFVVSGADDRTLKVWALATGQKIYTLRGHTGAVTAVTVTPNGQHVVSASEDQTLKLWDLTSGQELCTLCGHQSVVTKVAITPDGRRIVSGSGDRILKVWDLVTKQDLLTFRGHKLWITALAMTPDGQQVISASGDHTLKVWNLATGQEIRTLRTHGDTVRAVAVTANGKYVAYVSRDRLTLLNLETGTQVASFVGDCRFECVALSISGSTFIVGDAQGNIHFLYLEVSS